MEPIVVYNTAVQTPLPAAPTTPSGATRGTEAGTMYMYYVLCTMYMNKKLVSINVV